MPAILPGRTDLYALTDSRLSLGRPLAVVAGALLESGVRILQYREKKLKAGKMLEECRLLRRLVGPDMLIGLSTHTPEQAVAAVNAGADYIGVGPIFATQTKEDVVDPVGFDYLEWVARNIELPFVAIGGIKEHNIAEVARHGARCCALVSELVGAQDIHAKVEAVRRAMRKGLGPDGAPAAR